MIKRVYLIGLLVSWKVILAYNPTYACQNTHVFHSVSVAPNYRPGQLFLGINTLSFIKNDEYFGAIIQGHTLLGHHLHPYLSYYPSKQVQVHAGLFLRRDWADVHCFSYVKPTFSVQYCNASFTLLLGSIESDLGHGLIKPLYNVERLLLRGPESGLQFQYKGFYTFIDIWLEWLALLDKHLNKPEELCAGFNLEQILIENTKGRLSIPIQVLLYHLGGQGITTRDYSLLLGAIGAKCILSLPGYLGMQNISFENYLVFSRYIKEVIRPFKAGKGFYSKINLKTAWIDIGMSYWYGRGFVTENLGDPLYQSIAWVDQQVTHQEEIRELFLVGFNYSYQLAKNLHIGLYIAPYYDFKNKLLEHSENIYISYQPIFQVADVQQVSF